MLGWLASCAPARSKAVDFYNAGVDSANNGDNQKAIESYTSAIQLDAGFAPAYENRGALYNQMGHTIMPLLI